MNRLHRLAVVTLFGASVALPGGAQTPPERAAFGAFRDSLRATIDTARIRTLEHQWERAAKNHSGQDAARLHLGFVQLRRGEVEQRRDEFESAEATFNDVATARQQWSLAWFGRGLARLNLASSRTAPGGMVGHLLSGDPAADAGIDLARAAGVDSTFIEGLVESADIAATDYDPGHLRAALVALRRVSSKPASRTPDVQLARARIERIGGDLDSAVRISSALLASEPDNPLVMLEAAHAALVHGDESASALWFRGLTVADAGTAQLYRNDLVLLFPDSVLRRFDAATGRARAEIVRQFLARDEAGQFRSVDSRLREHYMRLDHARKAYTLRPVTYRADAVVSFRPGDFAMDERGLVWVLHGPPDDHTYLNQLSAPPNESWHYKDGEGGELLFHFIKTDARGFRRIPSLFDILALTKPLQSTGHGDVKGMMERGEAVQTYGASWTAQTVQDMLYSREAMSPTYGRMLSRGRNGALELQREERSTGDSSIARGETQFTHYELPLDAQIDAIAVGTEGGTELLQVAFGIPGTSLYAPPSTDQVVYPVRMRVSVIRNGTGEVAAAIDTLRNFVAAHPVPADGMLFGRLPIRVPPGDYTVRVALETPGRGVMSPRLVVRVAGNTRALDLSDLALGARSVRLPWRTPAGDSLWVNPARAFRRGEPMQVYYEVLGLAPGTHYQSAIAVFRGDASRPDLRFDFPGIATGSRSAVHREIDLGQLKPGSYQLQVTISTASGQPVVRRGEFTVVR